MYSRYGPQITWATHASPMGACCETFSITHHLSISLQNHPIIRTNTTSPLINRCIRCMRRVGNVHGNISPQNGIRTPTDTPHPLVDLVMRCHSAPAAC